MLAGGHPATALKANTMSSEQTGQHQSRSLFHYTTAQGLIGIVRSQSLFATNSNFLNDASECQSLKTLLMPIVQDEIARTVAKLVDKKLLSPHIRDNPQILAQQAESVFSALIGATNNVAPYHIASFCIHDEKEKAYRDGLLSQWRSYARGGFAIEFDELSIDSLVNQEHAKHLYQGILTNSVSYDDHVGRADLPRFNGMANALLKELFSDSKEHLEELRDIFGSGDVGDFVHSFLEVSPFLKNDGFREEREFRIVALCNRPNRQEDGDFREPKAVKFLARSGGDIVPYIELFETLDEKLPIKSVIVGPHPQQTRQRMAVELLLETQSVKAEIRMSEIPFRD